MPAPDLFLIYVTEVRRATDFYRDLIEIEPVTTTPRYVPFEAAPGVVFALWERPKRRGHSADPALLGNRNLRPERGSGRRHAALRAAAAVRRGLWQLFAHLRAHGLVAGDGSVGGLFVPGVGCAAVSDVAEPVIQRAGPRVGFFDA